jgi:DNA-binding transcriptional LysR family regulator
MSPPRHLRPPGRPRPQITLDQLHTFVAVADSQHITAAAETLHLAQGSVSAAVRRLEATLGLPLLHRVGRNVRLTDVGRAVRQLAIRTLDEASEVEHLASGCAAFERGEITIAAGRVTGAHLLSGWLASFVREHPDIELRIHLAPVQELLAMLHEGSTDVVIVGFDLRLPDIETVVLQRTELVVVVAAQHPLAVHAAPMHDLRRHRYLAHESGTATQSRALRLLGAAAEGLHELVLEEGALHAALLAGLGFAVMPRAAVERDITDGRLVELRHSGRRVRQPFTAARRRGRQTPAVDAVWRHLLEVSKGQTREVHQRP